MAAIDQVKQFLAAVAPELGTALGGPLGGYAGSLVARALGAKSNKPEDLAVAVQNATPDQIIALQKERDNFLIQMRDLGIKEEQLVYADVASARAMQMANKDPSVTRLGMAIVVGFYLFCGLEAAAMIIWPGKWNQLSQAAVGMLGTILGYLASESKAVTGFLYGSSAGSQAKDQTIAEIAKS